MKAEYKMGCQLCFKPKASETFRPNCEFVKHLGVLNGKRVCKILYGGDPWIVRHDELCGGNDEYAKMLQARIDKYRLPNQKKKELAKSLLVSPSTLRRWLVFIRENLPQADKPLATSDSPFAAGTS